MANTDARRAATGRAIRARRRERNLSQRALGQVIGRSQSWVAKVEAGDLSLSLADACRLAVALGGDVASLTGEDAEPDRVAA